MQERRKTIRLIHRCRAQQRASDDLLPHRSWIRNLSEQGIGLLVRRAYRQGERISVTFSLPGQREPMTLTGTVRWSGSGGTPTQRWQPLGLEWLPPEETPRNRLQQWLTHAPPPATGKGRAVPAWLPAASLSALLLVGAIGGFWVVSLQRQRYRLESTIQQRDTVIRTLAVRGQVLESNLDTAKKQLAQTSAQVVHLDQQAHTLEGAVQQLTQEVVSSKQAYAAVHEEREALMQHVLELEQERLLLRKRLTSIPELRVAMKEAVEAHQQAQRAEQQRLREARRAAERQQLALGNRGYLFRQGHPTVNASTVWIHIHDPEAGESQAMPSHAEAQPASGAPPQNPSIGR